MASLAVSSYALGLDLRLASVRLAWSCVVYCRGLRHATYRAERCVHTACSLRQQGSLCKRLCRIQEEGSKQMTQAIESFASFYRSKASLALSFHGNFGPLKRSLRLVERVESITLDDDTACFVIWLELRLDQVWSMPSPRIIASLITSEARRERCLY